MKYVYIVIIQTEQMDTKVGAVYLDENAARAEVGRLRDANSFNDVYFIIRQVEDTDQ